MKRGRKNSLQDLTAEYLKSILHYDPDTGIFTWRQMLSKRRVIGKQAGFMQHKGRIKIGINNQDYMLHRLAYLYMTGKWPEYEIDHINNNQSDNRWCNLRHATPWQNHCNKGLQKNNTTGYKGVCKPTGKNFYMAYIKHKGKRYHLGCFKTAEEAFAAYQKAAKQFQGPFVHKSS